MREADGRGVVCAANVHNFSKKANDAVLGQDVLKGMLPNSIQQLSIAEI